MTDKSKNEDVRDAEVGKPLVISFEEAATAGYLWSVKETADLEVTKSKKPNHKGFGASSFAEFSVVASKPGTYEVEFEYKRPWQDKVEEKRTVTLNVR